MLKYVIPALCLCCCSGLAMSPQDSPPAASKPAASSEEATVNEIIRVYADTFNKHDAKALASFWAAKCVSCNGDANTRVCGREAVQAGFEQVFKANPGCKLTTRLKHFRFLKPDLLTLEGEAIVTSPNQETSENQFTAILIKVGDKWEIEHATESPIPVAETAYDGLQPLEWLIGTWADETPGVTCESTITWSDKKTFLIRKYSITFEKETEAETGTQIIGWDPRSKSIRSWTFSADGSFGEGSWSHSDNEWRVKFNPPNADGSVESGTQVITKVDDQSATVQLVGHEADGELSPSRPAVKMVKKPTTATEEPKK